MVEIQQIQGQSEMTSPFDWKGKPSIIANDIMFKSFNGKTRNQIYTETVQKSYDRGANIGTILISDKTEDGLSEAFERIHRRKK